MKGCPRRDVDSQGTANTLFHSRLEWLGLARILSLARKQFLFRESVSPEANFLRRKVTTLFVNTVTSLSGASAAIVAGIYRLIDMGSTTINVMGDMVGTAIVSHSERHRAEAPA